MMIMFSGVLSLASFSASAADHVLNGSDAVDMARVLTSSGIGNISDVTLEFVSAQNLFCEGQDFVDQCQATFADAHPAANSSSIVPSSAQEFWSLLKKAGFEDRISQVADGTSGKTVISASRVDCELHSDDESKDECTFQ